MCVWKDLSKKQRANRTWLALLTSNEPGELVKIFSPICSEAYSCTSPTSVVGAAEVLMSHVIPIRRGTKKQSICNCCLRKIRVERWNNAKSRAERGVDKLNRKSFLEHMLPQSDEVKSSREFVLRCTIGFGILLLDIKTYDSCRVTQKMYLFSDLKESCSVYIIALSK